MFKKITLKSICHEFSQEKGLPKPIRKFQFDSREVAPGDFFTALKGERSDGHAYLRQVAKNGALGAFVSPSYNGPTYGLLLVKVNDPLEALQTLAKKRVEAVSPRIVAITGSLGKTTTKDFALHLLQKSYRTVATEGNRNSKVGLPTTLLNQLEDDTELLIAEMGMTKAGHISRLIETVPPDISLLTSVDLVHAVNFANLEEIAESKAEIFRHPKTKHAILPYEVNQQFSLRLPVHLEKKTFSIKHVEADYFWGDKTIYKERENWGTINQVPYRVKQHNHNLLAAMALADHFGVSWEEIKEIVPNLKLPRMRFEQVVKQGVTFINDAYNAATTSTVAALRSLPKPKAGGRRLAVIGGMRELGKFSEEAHTKVGEEALHHIDLMLCLGTECRPIIDVWRKFGRSVFLCKCRAELAEKIKKEMVPGDVVLLKGSRTNELWKILDEIED